MVPLAHNGVPVEGCVVRVEPVDASNGFITYYESSTLLSENRRTDESLELSRPIGIHGGVRISVQVETTAKTGVEMEALTGVMGAALTVVDMCKGVDKGCVIAGVRVAGKKGGRSGGLGIWRERPDEGSKGLDGPLEVTERDTVEGATQFVDKESKEPEISLEEKESDTFKKTMQLAEEALEALDEETVARPTGSVRMRKEVGFRLWRPIRK